VTDQQLAFRALADFGRRWRRVRDVARLRRRRPSDAVMMRAIFASLAPWHRL